MSDPTAFRARFDAALSVLRTRDGFASADLVRNLDDSELWALVTRWRDVGSYRRALQGYESKAVVAPLLSEALDELSELIDGPLTITRLERIGSVVRAVWRLEGKPNAVRSADEFLVLNGKVVHRFRSDRGAILFED